MDYFDDALEINPDDVDALSYKGGLLVVIGNYPNARILIDNALAISPNNPWALKNKGELLLASAKDYNYTKAMEYL